MDAYLLHALIPELSELNGSSVRGVEQTDRFTLQIRLHKEDPTRILALSCDPVFPRVEPLAAPLPAIESGAFVNALRVYLSHAELLDIRQIGFDRIVALGFSRSPTFGPAEQLTLLVRLFGRGANLYLESSDGSLVSLKPGPIPRPSREGRAPRPAGPERIDPLSASDEKIREAFAASPQATPGEVLVRRFTGISPLWAAEIVFRADLEAGLPLGRLKPWQVDLLCSHLSAWISEVRSGVLQPCVYDDAETGMPLAVSPQPLGHLRRETCRRFERVSDAVSAFYRAVVPAQREAALREKIERKHREELGRVDRGLERVALRIREAAREAEFRRFGELIISNLGDLTHGQREVSVIDHYDLGRPRIRIPVDPSKSPRANAERYFAKARKCQRAKKALAQEKARLTARKEDLERALSAVSSAGGETLRNQALELGLLPREARAPHPPKETAVPFRTFRTTSGWTVWVGRNDRENDLLTHSRAAPHDYWFHARGLAGSHVVLRRPDRTQRPSRKTIQEAAEIAAYFSKGRKSKTVDVTYTEKKYVRKPRRGKPGLALVTNEEVVFVTPRLPGGS